MKKFILYSIIFISLFVGTATCVIINGYVNYQKELASIPQEVTQQDNTALTTLATSVLNSECYSGEINFSNLHKTTNVSGTFSYINKNGVSANIYLNGSVNNFSFDTNILLLNNELFVEFNGIKLGLNTNDIVSCINEIISTINTSSNTEFSEIDMSSIQNLLSNISTNPLGSGYCINANIPNICDLYIATNADYIPHQILATNIVVGNDTYTLNITASQTLKQMPTINEATYINATPALKYIAPILSTLNQEKIGLGGIVNINGLELKVSAYLIDKSMIFGTISHKDIKIDYQFDGKFININFYGNVYKLSIQEIEEIINSFNFTKNTTTSRDLISLLTEIKIEPTIKNGTISHVFAQYGSILLDLDIGKTLYSPKTFETNNAQTAKDLINLIYSYKNIISTNYSLDINFNYENININGKAYIDLNPSFSGINKIYFNGEIAGYKSLISYTSTETYIKIAENKIKLTNSSLEKTISAVLDLINNNSTKNISLSTNIDISLLNNVILSGRTIKLSSENFNIQLDSFINTYKLSVSSENLNASINIMPNSTNYKNINDSINIYEFIDYSDAHNLITAIKNTLNENTLTYKGNIDVNLLDFNIYNIGIIVKADIVKNRIEITLSNLPTDQILTYFSGAYYKNNTSKIVIENGTMSICSTITHKLTNKTLVYTNKTIKLSEFNLNHLTDIMALKECYVNILNSNKSSSSISTNISTSIADIYKNNACVNLNPIFNNTFSHLIAEFYYTNTMNKATLHCNLENVLFVNINLEKK